MSTRIKSQRFVVLGRKRGSDENLINVEGYCYDVRFLHDIVTLLLDYDEIDFLIIEPKFDPNYEVF